MKVKKRQNLVYSVLIIFIVILRSFRRMVGASAQVPEPPAQVPEPPAQVSSERGDIRARRSRRKRIITVLLNFLGAVFLVLISGVLGYLAIDMHNGAIADPANLAQALTPGSIAVIFNQPVTGQLNATVDLRNGSEAGHVTINGILRRSTSDSKSIQWAVFSYGSLKLFPLTTIGGYPSDTNGFPLDANGRPTGVVGAEETVEAANIDPSFCYRNIPTPVSSAGLSKGIACGLEHINDPNLVPGKLALHHGNIFLGKNTHIDFTLDGNVVGPLDAYSVSRIEASMGPIGGDSVLGWMQNSWTKQTVPNSSWKAIANWAAHFLPGGPQGRLPSSSITVHEAIQTAWSSSDGTLTPETSIITGAPSFPDPSHLTLTWKPGQPSYRSVSWEIENRLQQTRAQSEDFQAGIWAAVAATAALMALGVIGNMIITLIVGPKDD